MRTQSEEPHGTCPRLFERIDFAAGTNPPILMKAISYGARNEKQIRRYDLLVDSISPAAMFVKCRSLTNLRTEDVISDGFERVLVNFDTEEHNRQQFVGYLGRLNLVRRDGICSSDSDLFLVIVDKRRSLLQSRRRKTVHKAYKEFAGIAEALRRMAYTSLSYADERGNAPLPKV